MSDNQWIMCFLRNLNFFWHEFVIYINISLIKVRVKTKYYSEKLMYNINSDDKRKLYSVTRRFFAIKSNCRSSF